MSQKVHKATNAFNYSDFSKTKKNRREKLYMQFIKKSYSYKNLNNLCIRKKRMYYKIAIKTVFIKLSSFKPKKTKKNYERRDK